MMDTMQTNVRDWKRELCVILLLLMVLALASCGGSSPSDTSIASGPADTAPAVAASVEPAAAACQTLSNMEDQHLQVTKMEVTQGLDTGGVFISGRSTALLVHLESNSSDPMFLTGVLRICADGEAMPSLQAKHPITMAAASASASSAEMVFEPFILEDKHDVDFVVEISPQSDPTNVIHRTSVENLAFDTVTVPPALLYVRIDFEPSGLGAPTDDLVGPGNGDAFAQAVLPVSDASWFYHKATDLELLIPDGDCGEHNCQDPKKPRINSDEVLSQAEGNIVLKRLADIRNSLVFSDGSGITELVFLHGWITDLNCDNVDTVYKNGYSTGSNDRVAYVSTLPVKGQLIYVHEMLHNVGKPNTTSFAHPGTVTAITGVDGWDVGNRLPGNWPDTGIAIDDQRKLNYYEIMAYQETSNSWISPDESASLTSYLGSEKLREFYAKLSTCEAIPVEQQVGSPCLSNGNYVFSGVLSADDGRPFDINQTERVDITARYQVEKIEWLSQPTYTYSTVSYENTPFLLVFINRDQNQKEGRVVASIPFDARTYTFPNADGEEGADNVYLGFFEVVVPPYIAEQANVIEIAFRGQVLEEPFWESEQRFDTSGNPIPDFETFCEFPGVPNWLQCNPMLKWPLNTADILRIKPQDVLFGVQNWP